MDRQLIEALIDALERSSLSELEYERDGASLRLVKGAAVRHAPPAAASPIADRPSPVTPVAAAPGGSVASPLYGVVHLRPAPDAAAFVSLGQAVAAGQVLCTVEAMKVFTEIRAERAGTVLAIAVESGDEVEAGQALMELG